MLGLNNGIGPKDPEEEKQRQLRQGLLRGGMSQQQFDSAGGQVTPDANVHAQAQREQMAEPEQKGLLQENGLSREVTQRGDGQGFRFLDPEQEADRAILENRASNAAPPEEQKIQEGKDTKTGFEKLDGKTKFDMNQVLAAVPLLRNMDDAEFQANMPQLVNSLMDINPFLAKMIPEGGFTKQDLDDIVDGLGGVKRATSAKQGNSKFKLQKAYLPDGREVIGRFNEATGDLLVQDREGDKFVSAPFGTTLESKISKNKGGDSNELTLSQKSKQQEKVITLTKSLDDLKGLGGKYQEEFLKFGGKIRAAGTALRDKIGGPLAPNKKDKEFLASKSVFTGRLQAYFDQYKKAISGATVGEKEMEDLVKSIVSGKDSPTEFEAKFSDIVGRMEDDIERETGFLETGIDKQGSEKKGLEDIQKIASGEQVEFKPSGRRKSKLQQKLGNKYVESFFSAQYKQDAEDLVAQMAEQGKEPTEQDLADLANFVEEELREQFNVQR